MRTWFSHSIVHCQAHRPFNLSYSKRFIFVFSVPNLHMNVLHYPLSFRNLFLIPFLYLILPSSFFNYFLLKGWLEKHADFEFIVDGANIGLYQQNFADGGFSVSQVV